MDSIMQSAREIAISELRQKMIEQKAKERQKKLEALKSQYPDDPTYELDLYVHEESCDIDLSNAVEDNQLDVFQEAVLDSVHSSKPESQTLIKWLESVGRQSHPAVDEELESVSPSKTQQIQTHDLKEEPQLDPFTESVDCSTKALTYPRAENTYENLGAKTDTPISGRRRDLKAEDKLTAKLQKVEQDILQAGQLVEKQDWYQADELTIPKLAPEDIDEQVSVYDKRRDEFIAAWQKTKIPPENPSLEWLSVNYDVINGFGHEKVGGTFKLMMKHAKHEMFTLENLSNFQYDRLPEFSELEKMFYQTPAGFIIDTPENQVSVFEFVFAPHEFDIKKFETLPNNLGLGIISQYLMRPRTVQEYCVKVWKKHLAARARVEQLQQDNNENRLAAFNASKKGEKQLERDQSDHPEQSDQPEQSKPLPELYYQLMQDCEFLPKQINQIKQGSEIKPMRHPRAASTKTIEIRRENQPKTIVRVNCTFNQFYTSCKTLFTQRWVTLQVPSGVRDQEYVKACQLLARLEDTTIRMPNKTAYQIQETIRAIQKNLKDYTRISIRNCVLSSLPRFLSQKLQSQFPQCYRALSFLPVRIQFLDRIQVSFYLTFPIKKDKKKKTKMTLFLWEFSSAYYRLYSLEEDMKKLQGIASKLPQQTKVDQTQSSRLKEIESLSGDGKAGCDSAIEHLNDLIQELEATE